MKRLSKNKIKKQGSFEFHGMLMMLGLLMFVCAYTSSVFSQNDKRPKTLKMVIAELKAEAKASLKDQAWLREKADYAKTSKLTFEADAVIPLLSKRLDKNPSIDAYIKWQITSFLKKKDFEELSSKSMLKLLMTTPGYLPYPKLPSQWTSSWAAISGQSNPTKSALDQAHRSWREFTIKMRDPLTMRNQSIHEYRKKMESMISFKSVFRTYFRLLSLESQLKAGISPLQYAPMVKNGDRRTLLYNIYFIGMTRSEDWNARTKALIDTKVQEIAAIQLKTYHAPFTKYGKHLVGLLEDKSFEGRYLKIAYEEELAKATQ